MIDVSKVPRHQQRWTVEQLLGGFWVPDKFFFESEEDAKIWGERTEAYRPGKAWRTALYINVECIP